MPIDWLLAKPRSRLDLVNQPQTEAEVIAIRPYILCGCPYRTSDWVQSTAVSLGLQSTLRPRGRPRIMEE